MASSDDLSAVLSQIKTMLEAISGIGKVYKYERDARSRSKFIELFKTSDGLINAWMLSRKRTPQKVYAQGGSTTRTHLIKITGIYGLDDVEETELTFQYLIEDIVDAFDPSDSDDRNLSDNCFSIAPVENAPEGQGGIQVDTVGLLNVGGLLCHFCELSLYVQMNY